jgi:hypothetical protein
MLGATAIPHPYYYVLFQIKFSILPLLFSFFSKSRSAYYQQFLFEFDAQLADAEKIPREPARTHGSKSNQTKLCMASKLCSLSPCPPALLPSLLYMRCCWPWVQQHAYMHVDRRVFIVSLTINLLYTGFHSWKNLDDDVNPCR